MINYQDLESGGFRLLETDNRVVLPYLISVRVLISRADVLHSWAVPRLGVKLDAMPGRLNQTNFGDDAGTTAGVAGNSLPVPPVKLL